VLVVAGARALGDRSRALARFGEPTAAPAPPAAAPAANETVAREDASIHERVAAFGIDMALVLAMLIALETLAPRDLLAHVKDDPSGRVAFAIGAWGAVGVIAYFAVIEAVFGRTPGKRILGLEVRDVATGERPTPLALVYRNLFRIEVVFATTVISLLSVAFWVPLLSLLVMLATPRTQRPGDIIAGTVVQRMRRRASRDAAEDDDDDGER
jgi:uncharacterized RDD family membrane protein YckC